MKLLKGKRLKPEGTRQACGRGEHRIGCRTMARRKVAASGAFIVPGADTAADDATAARREAAK